MPDREKVIKGLYQHCEGSMFDRCGECPYYEVADEPFRCRDALLMDVLTLLREQEPVEPHVEHDSDDDSWYYGCGACHEAIDYKDKFCRHCGKKVKWDES